MKTRIYNENDLKSELVKQDIKDTINQGRLVVFPTETVYGIGASAFNIKGLKEIYKTKGRPSDNPLIVHIKNKKEVFKYIKNFNVVADKLSDLYWPGPLTLVLEKLPLIKAEITGGLETVAIRVPSNSIAQKVIEIAGPICAPSANISGRPSSTLFGHVFEDFDGRVDIIIDGGKSEIGLESTVVDVTTETPVILRPGAITKQMIKKATNIEPEIGYLMNTIGTPKAPGMKYRHYSPKGKVTIVTGNKSKVIKYINNQVGLNDLTKIKTYIICSLEHAKHLESPNLYIISKDNDTLEIAANLYESLRYMDKHDVKKIYVPKYNRKI